MNLLALSLLLSLKFLASNCDHLQQSNDNPSQPDAQTNQQQSAQLADPAYIKRELKDVVMMQVDADQDGSVSHEELKNYLARLHEKSIDFNVDKQWVSYQPQIHEVFSWEGYEPEKKEILTWDHYFNQTYPELIGVDVGIPVHREQDTSSFSTPAPDVEKGTDKKAKEEEVKESAKEEDSALQMLKLMVQRADIRWKLADENGDTLLTKEEFKHLLHPDEGHEELQALFVREATEDMDLDKNGKISLNEFMKHLKVLASDQERDDQGWMASQQENFGRFLDKNKDGLLDGDEIKDWLIPSKSKKFEAEAKRLFDIGDKNEDYKLTNVEILDQYEHFVSLLPPEYWQQQQQITLTDDESNSINHDEL